MRTKERFPSPREEEENLCDEEGGLKRTRERSWSSYFPPMFLLKGTVVLKIWSQGLLMTIYTTVVVCLHTYVMALRMYFPLTLVPILGVATGLVLAFRTNTAYGRYWEGRKIWSRMTVQLRFLTLCLWAGGSETSQGNVSESFEPDEEANNAAAAAELIEKVSAINLLIAFAYSTKNYLRGEYSHEEKDVRDLIIHLPHFQTPSSNQPFASQTSYSRRGSADLNESWKMEEFEKDLSASLAPTTKTGTNIQCSNEKEDVDMDESVMATEKRETFCVTTMAASGVDDNGGSKIFFRNLKAHDYVTPTNIPIEIIYHLFSYLKDVGSKANCDGIVLKYMYGSLYTLIDCLTAFERILRTPIPLAYSVHLHFCIWLYLLSLPYQLVASLDWFTIPAVGLASFALLGILRIGFEIENPFGDDTNDLPLDDFCMVIRREIQMIVGHRLPGPRSWIMSDKNRPFAPISHLNAEQLTKMPLHVLTDILAKGGTELTSKNCNKHMDSRVFNK